MNYGFCEIFVVLEKNLYKKMEHSVIYLVRC